MRIVFLPTMRCNLRCIYCYEHLINEKKNFEEVPWQSWIKLFESMPSATVDISGGEPTIYSDFVDLVNNFPSKHLLAFSTNLTISETTLKQIKRRFWTITCSIHPQYFEEDFFKKARIIQKLSLKPLILNFVDYPPHKPLLETYKSTALNAGYMFNIEPYVDINKIEEGKEIKKCSAGINYFLILPDGETWRCNTAFCYHYYKKRKPEFMMGNIFSGFKRVEKEVKCDLTCVHGCDLYQRGLYNGQLFGKFKSFKHLPPKDFIKKVANKGWNLIRKVIK